MINLLSATYKVPVVCGIKIDNHNTITFNWNKDDKDDVIHLTSDQLSKYDSDGVRYVYGYSYNPQSKRSDRNLVRKYMKSLPEDEYFSDDMTEFVDNALLSLDSTYPLSNFSVVVSTESSSNNFSLVDLIDVRFSDMIDHNQFWVDLQLVKSMYSDVEFDVEKARSILREEYNWSENRIQSGINNILKQFGKYKDSHELFQMKKFVPRELRGGFSNFLKFKNKDEENLYFSLQGVEVLLLDDFWTSGTTVKEMIRCLRSIHDKNRLTVFVLVKQH